MPRSAGSSPRVTASIAVDELKGGLAVYRVARLVVDDTIFDAPRQRVLMWAEDRSKFLHGLLSCGYCVSVWLAFFETARRRPKRPFTSWMAVAAVAAVAWSIDRVAVNTEQVVHDLEDE